VGSSDSRAARALEVLKNDCSVDSVAWSGLAAGEAQAAFANAEAVLVEACSLPQELRAERICDLVRSLLQSGPRPRIVVMLESDEEETAARAVAAGAWDVLRCSEAERVIAERMRMAARIHRLELEGSAQAVDGASSLEVSDDAGANADEPVQMVGSSPQMREVFALIRRVAATDVPVLISGESGTGKEMAALAIHERSARAQGAFVPINCAAIPESLLESELFGHERGAFTGAMRPRAGRVEAAAGGTLFLDEIGELSPSIQVKLLRFLQDHVVERVGGHRRIPLDVRVIAATNRNLAECVADGTFREDLYYRLAVFTLHLPPLRDRGEDVVLMARFFLRRYARESQRPLEGFTRDALLALSRAPLPGNVRELINRIRRGVVVAEGVLVSAQDLGLKEPDGTQELHTLREARHRAEIESIRDALLRTEGNRSEAARRLGISRTQLYELMHRYELITAESG